MLGLNIIIIWITVQKNIIYIYVYKKKPDYQINEYSKERNSKINIIKFVTRTCNCDMSIYCIFNL